VTRLAQSVLKLFVLFRVGFKGSGPFGVRNTGRIKDEFQLARDYFRPGNQCGYFLFLNHFPGDELQDVRMIDIQADHLGGASGSTARFDCPGGAIADSQKGHQSRRITAPGKDFTGATNIGEIRAGAGTVLEQPGFTHPEIHDTVVANQVILNRLNKTGVWLRVFIGIISFGQGVRIRVDIIMTLRFAGDTIGVVKSGVEPLW